MSQGVASSSGPTSGHAALGNVLLAVHSDAAVTDSRVSWGLSFSESSVRPGTAHQGLLPEVPPRPPAGLRLCMKD